MKNSPPSITKKIPNNNSIFNWFCKALFLPVQLNLLVTSKGQWKAILEWDKLAPFDYMVYEDLGSPSEEQEMIVICYGCLPICTSECHLATDVLDPNRTVVHVKKKKSNIGIL